MNRSPWERGIFGTYIRTANIFEQRRAEQMRIAGVAPLAPPLPRIRARLATPDGQGVGDPDTVEIVDLDEEDGVGNADDPRLLTAD